MIKQFVLWLLRERLAELDTMSFSRTETLRLQTIEANEKLLASVNSSLADSFLLIRKELDALKSDLQAVRSTAQDNVNDLHAVMEAVALEVDIMGGGLVALEQQVEELTQDLNVVADGVGVEMDDLESRIDDLESSDEDLEEVVTEVTKVLDLLKMLGIK